MRLLVRIFLYYLPECRFGSDRDRPISWVAAAEGSHSVRDQNGRKGCEVSRHDRDSRPPTCWVGNLSALLIDLRYAI